MHEDSHLEMDFEDRFTTLDPLDYEYDFDFSDEDDESDDYDEEDEEDDFDPDTTTRADWTMEDKNPEMDEMDFPHLVASGTALSHHYPY